MPKVVITGANGFIGKNLAAHLAFKKEYELEQITRADDEASIIAKLKGADVVFHLAGANRPPHEVDFISINVELTQKVLSILGTQAKPCKIIITSSVQASQDNPYGNSKKAAEDIALNWVINTPHEIIIYRLPGVFGKWCKPNYNSVVATFCHNIAIGKSLEIRDPAHTLSLVYIDDVVASLVAQLNNVVVSERSSYAEVTPLHVITLEHLADTIKSFAHSRKNLVSPAVGDYMTKALYSTYLSYLPKEAFSYPMDLKVDDRGDLFEWIKNPCFGQIFVSTTKPGVTRGNHFHHTKTEKFLIIKGSANIKFRKINDDEVIEYFVSGEKPTVVDIPPGYTHNLTNIGDTDLIALFWANEVFDSARPDTQFLEV